MKVLRWLKAKMLWVLGGIILVFGAIFAIKYEKQRIDKLKMRAQLIQEVAENKRVIAYAEGKDKGLERAEQVAAVEVSKAKQLLDQLEKEVPGRSADEIANRFNHIYGRRHNDVDSNGSGNPTD